MIASGPPFAEIPTSRMPLSLCHSEVSTGIQSNLDLCWIWMNVFFKQRRRDWIQCSGEIGLCTVAVLHFPDRWIKRVDVFFFVFFLLLSFFISAEWDLSSPPCRFLSPSFLPSFPPLTLHLSRLVLIVRLCNWGNAVNDVWVVSLSLSLSLTHSHTHTHTHTHTHRHWWRQIGLFH